MIDFFVFLGSIFDFKTIVNGLVVSLIVALTTFLLIKLYLDRIRNSSIFQSHIYSGSNFIVCPEGEYIVKQLPELLSEYRKKLYSTDDKPELLFWNTRISTFIIFTDGERVLVLDRRKNIENEIIHNEKIDCHGAFQFHNPTLETKLPESFMSSKIIKLESIPGIALEQNSKLFLNKHKIPYKREIAIMLGFIAYMNKSDLEQSEDKKNRLVNLSCLSLDDSNLTSKTKLGIKHLLTLRSKSEASTLCVNESETLTP